MSVSQISLDICMQNLIWDREVPQREKPDGSLSQLAVPVVPKAEPTKLDWTTMDRCGAHAYRLEWKTRISLKEISSAVPD
ncbi:hypothetical protein V6N13_127717 [Hibiscus sabdariffa]